MLHHSPPSHIDRLDALMKRASLEHWYVQATLDCVATFGVKGYEVLPINRGNPADDTQLILSTLSHDFCCHEQGIRKLYESEPRPRLLTLVALDKDDEICDCWMSHAYVPNVDIQELPHSPGMVETRFTLLLCPPKE